MIQFNLLPDIKQQYIKAQQTRRLITLISMICVVVSVVLVIVLVLGVEVEQKKHMSDLSNDIKSNTNKIKSVPQINKILTVQNQLSSLTSLHEQKPAVSQLFNYLQQTTPAQVDISNLVVDFNAHTFSITGSTPDLATVDKYVDTLKFTKYQVQGSSTQTLAFSQVVLSSFGTSNGKSSYTITLNYDPTIFDITQSVKLVVPNMITTRSELDKPSPLFKNQSNDQTGGGQ